MARIDSFFKFMLEQNASDLHLSTGNQPMLRIHGELVRIDAPPLDSDDLKALVYEIAPATWILVTNIPASLASARIF
jgi:twitching motility protein PilT